MMWNNKIVIIVVLLCSLRQGDAACTINVNSDLAEPQPLLIQPGTSTFFNPTGRFGIITVNDNAQIGEIFITRLLLDQR